MKKQFKKQLRKLLSLVVAASLISLSSSISVPVMLAGNTYYVAVGGSNSGNGSFTSPWGTIQYGMDQLYPGDTLIIREGAYYEKLIMNKSGSADNYITIKGEAGKRVIVDGDRESGGLNNSRKEMLLLADKSFVRIEGLEFCNNNADNRGSDTNIGIKVAATSSGGSNGVQIVDCKVYGIDGETWSYPASSGNNACDMNGHGIAVYGGGRTQNDAITDLLIEGNEVFDNLLGQSEALVINGNVDGFIVSGNYVHDNNNIGIDIIGGERTSGGGAAIDRARNGQVRNNVVINNNTDSNQTYGNGGGAVGIYVDGGKDIDIYGNYIVGSHYGLEIATEISDNYKPTGINVRHNLVAFSYAMSSDFGACMLLGNDEYGAGVAGQSGIYVENNTFYNPSGSGNCLEWGELAGTVLVQENILISSGSKAYVTGSSTSASYGSGNVYYGRSGGKPANDNNGYQYTNTSILPVASLATGDFTLTGNNLPPAHPNAGATLTMPSDLLQKAINNYAARLSAVTDSNDAYTTANSGNTKGSASAPLTMAKFLSYGGNVCRYFEDQGNIKTKNTKVYLKYAGSAGSEIINGSNTAENSTARYSGIIGLMRGIDGKINYEKLANFTNNTYSVSNGRIILRTPYEANGQISHIDRQIAGVVISLNKAEIPVLPDLSGKIKSYDPNKPTTIRLIKDDKEISPATITDTNNFGQVEQEFRFKDLAQGRYDLVITKDVHTKFTVLNLIVGDRDLDLTLDSRPEVQLMTLRCGDINGDGLINDADLTVLWRAGNYNKRASEAENDRCDLNGDGLINDADLTILWLAYNYNRGAIIIE